MENTVEEILDENIEEEFFDENIEEETPDEKWDRMYNLLRINHVHYGYLNIPNGFRTINGIEYDENGYKLYEWLQKEKRRYRLNRMKPDRIEKLKKKGVVFNPTERIWNEMFESYKKYAVRGKEIPEDLLVNGRNLNNWVAAQKAKYKKNKLTKDQIEKLKSVNFLLRGYDDDTWDNRYTLARKYYKLYGHINFKRKEEFENELMGQWIQTQRNRKLEKKLSPVRENKLVQIGIVFNIKANEKMIKDIFDEYCIDYGDYRSYIKNKSYQEIYSRFMYLKDNDKPIVINRKLNPIIYMSTNELEKEINISIEQLICMYYLKDTEEKNKVEDLIYNYKKDDRWTDMYKLAYNYYNAYDNLNVPVEFRTLDGITRDKNGYALGAWIVTQRENYKADKLSIERINLLNEIGMIYFKEKKKKTKIKKKK